MKPKQEPAQAQPVTPPPPITASVSAPPTAVPKPELPLDAYERYSKKLKREPQQLIFIPVVAAVIMLILATAYVSYKLISDEIKATDQTFSPQIPAQVKTPKHKK